MDAKEAAARDVLERFAPQLRWTVRSVMESFGLPTGDYDDIRQEAEILVCSYAGLFDTPMWGNDLLAKWYSDARRNLRGEDIERQVKHLLGRQLRLNLTQIVSRGLERTNDVSHFDSLDALVDTSEEPTDDTWEDRQIDAVDSAKAIERYRRNYPTLAANILDGQTQEEIAQEKGVTRMTISRRISAEKRAFMVTYLRRSGLKVEGNETEAELTEAYEHISKAGR